MGEQATLESLKALFELEMEGCPVDRDGIDVFKNATSDNPTPEIVNIEFVSPQPSPMLLGEDDAVIPPYICTEDLSLAGRRASCSGRKRPSLSSYGPARRKSNAYGIGTDGPTSPNGNGDLRQRRRGSIAGKLRRKNRKHAQDEEERKKMEGAKNEGWSYRLLWLPALLFIMGIILLELVCYAAVRQAVNVLEYIWSWRGAKRKYRAALRKVTSYSEWKSRALELDKHMGKDSWKKEDAYKYYDYNLVRNIVEQMAYLRRVLTAKTTKLAIPKTISRFSSDETAIGEAEPNGTGCGTGIRAKLLGDTSTPAPTPSVTPTAEMDKFNFSQSTAGDDTPNISLSPSSASSFSDQTKTEIKITHDEDSPENARNEDMAKDEKVAREALSRLKEVLLQGGVKSNLGGVENDWLYKQTYFGTKALVENFYEEVAVCLEVVAKMPSSLLPTEEKREFFRRADRAHGRTSLCLSGGAAFGYYHLGVAKALLDNSVLPQVITGTSAGSLIAALICVRTDDELRAVLRPELSSKLTACGNPTSHILTTLKRILKLGVLFDADEWAEKTQWITKGSTTFLEAYKRTGRILNITAVPMESHSPPKLLNYLTTPDTVIWTAVLASSAVPGILKPVVLLNKTPDGRCVPYMGGGHKWRDGSLRTDIPLTELQQYFNVKYTIVSQVNPHISIFFFDHRGAVGRPSSHRDGKGWRGGFALSGMEHYLKLDLKKWLRVCRDLDLLPNFMQMDWSFLWLQKFDGNITILPKVSLLDFVYIITDPTTERLKEYIAGGERNTWPKLHMTRNRMLIERAIMAGMLKARKERREIYRSFRSLSEDKRSTARFSYHDLAASARHLNSSGRSANIDSPNLSASPSTSNLQASSVNLHGHETPLLHSNIDTHEVEQERLIDQKEHLAALEQQQIEQQRMLLEGEGVGLEEGIEGIEDLQYDSDESYGERMWGESDSEGGV